MKFTKQTIIFAITIASLAISSCSKYLDLKPKNSTYDEIFWTDANNVRKATVGAYAMLRSALTTGRGYFIFGDLASGNMSVSGDYWNYNSLVKTGGFKFSYVPYLEDTVWDWTRFYGIINQCNLIVDKTEAIDASNFSGGETEKNALIAEAKFLRAFTNFYMQRVWGDIILVKHPFDDPTNIPVLPRTPEEETLSFCIEDLTFASQHLPTTSSTKSRASSGAATALLAHVYAWKHDYTNAEIMANKVIEGSYALEDIDNYLDIWLGESKESIFEFDMLFRSAASNESSDFFNVFLADPEIEGKSMSSTWPIDADLMDNGLKQEGKRLDMMSKSVSGSTTVRLLTKYNNIVNAPVGSNTFVANNNLVLIRLADIYLLRAESLYKNSKENLALEDLNLIRNRAGLVDTTLTGEPLFQEIFQERRRELIGEGITQFDAIRMQMFDKLDEFSDAYTPNRIANKGYYWPLNMRKLLPQNELLTQNPWWKNN